MSSELTQPALKVWTCKIGGYVGDLPPGSDGPLRRAVSEAYERLTGHEDEFCFSGWGGSLDAGEMEVAYPNREPQPTPPSAPDDALSGVEIMLAEMVNFRDHAGGITLNPAKTSRYIERLSAASAALRAAEAEVARLREALVDLLDTVEGEGDWPVEIAAARAAIAAARDGER
jgi:hypothetical protein